MKTLLTEACEKITKEDWEKVVEKTRNLIASDFERDVRIDNIIDNEIIIYVSDDSSDSDTSNDESD